MQIKQASPIQLKIGQFVSTEQQKQAIQQQFAPKDMEQSTAPEGYSCSVQTNYVHSARITIVKFTLTKSSIDASALKADISCGTLQSLINHQLVHTTHSGFDPNVDDRIVLDYNLENTKNCTRTYFSCRSHDAFRVRSKRRPPHKHVLVDYADRVALCAPPQLHQTSDTDFASQLTQLTLTKGSLITNASIIDTHSASMPISHARTISRNDTLPDDESDMFVHGGSILHSLPSLHATLHSLPLLHATLHSLPSLHASALASLAPRLSALASLAPRLSALASLAPRLSALASLAARHSALASLAPRLSALASLAPRHSALASLAARLSALAFLAPRLSAPALPTATQTYPLWPCIILSNCSPQCPKPARDLELVILSGRERTGRTPNISQPSPPSPNLLSTLTKQTTYPSLQPTPSQHRQDRNKTALPEIIVRTESVFPLPFNNKANPLSQLTISNEILGGMGNQISLFTKYPPSTTDQPPKLPKHPAHIHNPLNCYQTWRKRRRPFHHHQSRKEDSEG
ncbi:hypothetical protein BLNAU_24961 [Blattamonas nauphoetae]|uniref:Ubiquitin-like domain-containing protein n=1 Tax=Blattamonas nauphoetae TaxID=2049346 RepID=A0ABQ9WKY5_9EUKA|nr:hypothetical protein BLNAU_24961 [Blattamonas nauphoetae]